MKEFTIRIQSVQDVRDFVALSTSRPYPVWVGTAQYLVSGKSFMELCCLDYSQPLRAVADCTEEEFQHFCRDAHRFLEK